MNNEEGVCCHSTPVNGCRVCHRACGYDMSSYDDTYDDTFGKLVNIHTSTINVLPCEGNDEPGYVRLVESMGSDLSVVRSARVSYNAAWRAGEEAGKDEKLLKYLLKNGHTSPFESVVFTFEVKAPIFVFRQWHRHRTHSYNEISGRYTELDMGFYLPNLEDITTQSKDNKQMRTNEQNEAAEFIRHTTLQMCDLAFITYRGLIQQGCPRELARGILPLNTYSKMFDTVDLHNLFHFIKLRIHPHAQKEIRVYAEAILKLIEPIVPISVAAFREFQLNEKA